MDMDDLKKTSDEITELFSDIEKDREKAIKSSREIIRLTKRVIHSVHLGIADEECIDELRKKVKESPLDLSLAHVTQDALAEYAETEILLSIVHDTPIPTFRELGISPQSWTLGLADSLGEVRRLLLNNLIGSEVENALLLFSKMEKIFDVLILFDVPDAIVPLRRKQDIARGIMDRTRTDITAAVLMKNKVS
jgi:Predicted RNA-binding protein of the translin family